MMKARALVLAVLLLLPSYLCAQNQLNTQKKVELDAPRVSTEKEISVAREDEARAMAAIARSKAALEKARALGDAEALAIASEALQTAESALKRARANLARFTVRLAAVNRLTGKIPAATLGVAGYCGGDVVVRSGNRTSPLAANTFLRADDRIETGANGSAELVFADGSLLRLGENSEFRIIESKSGKSRYEIVKGKLRGIVDCLARPVGQCPGERLYEYQSDRVHRSILFVRGTEFVISIGADGAVDYIVIHGKVEVSVFPDGQLREIGSGELVTITASGGLDGPYRVDIGAMNKWWEDD